MNDRTGHVSLWHPWQDKPGLRHELALFSDYAHLSVDEIVKEIGNGRKYAICTDILNSREVDASLIRDRRTEPYLSRTGSLAGLRVRSGRWSGFLIPGIQWGEQSNPTKDTLNNIQSIFSLFNREAITPSSLSEKVLRGTLPGKLYISRPSVPLRTAILGNRSIARVMIQRRGIKSDEAYEYDYNKKYLSVAAKGVPSPFISPVRFYHSDIWQDMPVSFMKVRVKAPESIKGIQPIQIRDMSLCRNAREGESWDTWVWNGKVQDCMEAGYAVEVLEGYSWFQVSNFMSSWADILYTACEKYREESFYPILKQMCQGLPGRFLKAPEIYTLVHRSEFEGGDVPLTANWQGSDSPMSEWFMRVDKESDKAREQAQLTPVGDYIVCEAERDIYHAAIAEQKQGNKILRIYVDSLTVAEPATVLEVGTEKGQFKVTKYTQVKVISNRFIGYIAGKGEVVKAPGYARNSRERLKLLKEEMQWITTTTKLPP